MSSSTGLPDVGVVNAGVVTGLRPVLAGQSPATTQSWEALQGVQMAMTAVIAMLCLAGMAFNLRFLVALRKESMAVLNEQPIPERRENDKPVARTA